MSATSGEGPIRPVILAGGAGTRLWPLSTIERPKHLLPLIGDPKYGVLAQGITRPLLHAERLAFRTLQGERVELQDPPPWSMHALRGLRGRKAAFAAGRGRGYNRAR